MNNDIKNTKIGYLLSGGMLVGIATMYGYLLAYRYQLGYADYFGIPPELIVVEIKHVLTVTFWILAFFFFGLPIINIIYGLFTSDDILKNKIGIYIISIAFLLFFGLFYDVGWDGWLAFLIVILVYTFLDFIWPIISIRNKKSYREKVHESYLREYPSINVIRAIGNFLGIRFTFIIWIGFILILLAHAKGEFDARTRLKFFVTKNGSEMVILNFYGDNVILAPFDRNTKEIYKKFEIKNLQESPLPMLVPENVGPLKLKD